jgi:hypothetical protein
MFPLTSVFLSVFLKLTIGIFYIVILCMLFSQQIVFAFYFMYLLLVLRKLALLLQYTGGVSLCGPERLKPDLLTNLFLGDNFSFEI